MTPTEQARRSDALFYGGLTRRQLCDMMAHLEADTEKGDSMRINVRLRDGAPLPKHARPGDAGMDLTSRETVDIAPQGTVMVHTGVSMEIPEGYVGLCFPRSGLASKRGVTLTNCVGVIDSGYRGEIMAPLYNAGHEVQTVERGERVCQIAVIPFETCSCVEVEGLSDTVRGTDGIGSTGRL